MRRKSRALTGPFGEWNKSIRQLSSIKARLGERHDQTRSPIPARSLRSAKCSLNGLWPEARERTFAEGEWRPPFHPGATGEPTGFGRPREGAAGFNETSQCG